jgi:hypothetical protein
MPRPRLVFFPAPTALALSPARANAFLSAHAAPRPLIALAKRGGLPFARALFAASFDDALADGLDLLARLATRAAKRALREAANARALSLGDAASLPPADLAAHVLSLRASEKEPRALGVVRRALLALAECDDAVFAYELVAADPRRARAAAEAESDLRAFMRKRAAWSDVWLFEDEDRGAFHVALLSPDEPDVTTDVDPKLGPTPRTHAALRFDRIDLDVPAGRVAIRTDHPDDVRALAAAVGRAFFGDAAFFSDRPAFTTRPLEALGSVGLAELRLPVPVTRVRVIACTKELIGVGRQRATGSAALALLEQGPTGAGGYLPEVTLRFDVAGEEAPVDVEVRLPGRFACNPPRWEAVARDAMASIGMLTPGVLGDDAWSLFPVRRPDWRLRKALGASAVDALLAQKALRRVVSRNVTTEELRAQGSNLLTFAVPGEPGASYAIPSDPSVPARDVRDRDREVLELDVAKLAAIRAREMKLEGEPRVRADGASAFHGFLRARETSLAFVSILRAPAGRAEREAIAKEIAAEVFPAHAVLLVPRGRAWGSGLFEVEYDGLVEGGIAIVARAVKLARLEDEIDPWRLTDAPLVVQKKTRRIWFHETLMDLADSGYAMIEGLARRPDEISSSRDVCKWISSAREDSQAARATRPKIVKWMAASFAGAGKRVGREEIERVVVVEGKKGYRLGVGVAVF